MKRNIDISEKEIIQSIRKEFETSKRTIQKKQDAYAIARLAVSQMKNKRVIKTILEILGNNNWIKLRPLGKQLKELGFEADNELVDFLVQNNMSELAEGLGRVIRKKLDNLEVMKIIKSYDVEKFKSIEEDISDDMMNKAFLASIGEGDEERVNPIFYELIVLAKQRKFIPSPYVMAAALSNIGVSGAMKIYDLGTDPDDSVARVAVLDIDRLMFIFSLNYKVRDVPMFAYDISFNENIQNMTTKDKDYEAFNTILAKMTGMNVSQLMGEADRLKKQREREIEDMSESVSDE